MDVEWAKIIFENKNTSVILLILKSSVHHLTKIVLLES